MEGNASVYQVNPVTRITGEGREECLRTWGFRFDTILFFISVIFDQSRAHKEGYPAPPPPRPKKTFFPRRPGTCQHWQEGKACQHQKRLCTYSTEPDFTKPRGTASSRYLGIFFAIIETASGTACSADIGQPTPQPAPQHHAGVAAMYALACLTAALLAYDHRARFRGPEPMRLPVAGVVV